MILAFDTETTGKADFRAPVDAEHQPHIVQLGAIIFDEQWKVHAELNVIIKPDGWQIPHEAASIHGITTEIAQCCGISAQLAIACFETLLDKAEVCVAHNLDFDALVVAANHKRVTNRDGLHTVIQGKGFCTMRAMTPICKLPGNYGDFKWPRLSEAYKHALGVEMEGAHNAMADVRACARIYRWLKEEKQLAC